MPNQGFEFVQLLVVDRVAIEQVHHQCGGRSLKRAVEKTLRQAPSDFIARYARTENKRASAMRVPDKTLTFHDAQQTLHGLVIRRRTRAQSVDDVLDCAVPQIPESIQDQKLRIRGQDLSGYRARSPPHTRLRSLRPQNPGVNRRHHSALTGGRSGVSARLCPSSAPLPN